jgi:2-C-methyl-D-erythritol 2,4-cyclodiphosphate synthase
MYRIGHGFDVHRLTENRKLILCGVEIPHRLGLLGHSDADVATHAVMDAVLGALALGDIGMLFPDHDPAYAGADSMKLLAAVLNHPAVALYELVNCDVTISAEKPKLAPFRDAMRAGLAAAFGSGIDQISVKATTTEKLGYCGREEGIAATAVVLLKKR